MKAAAPRRDAATAAEAELVGLRMPSLLHIQRARSCRARKILVAVPILFSASGKSTLAGRTRPTSASTIGFWTGRSARWNSIAGRVVAAPSACRFACWSRATAGGRFGKSFLACGSSTAAGGPRRSTWSPASIEQTAMGRSAAGQSSWCRPKIARLCVALFAPRERQWRRGEAHIVAGQHRRSRRSTSHLPSRWPRAGLQGALPPIAQPHSEPRLDLEALYLTGRVAPVRPGRGKSIFGKETTLLGLCGLARSLRREGVTGCWLVRDTAVKLGAAAIVQASRLRLRLPVPHPDSRRAAGQAEQKACAGPAWGPPCWRSSWCRRPNSENQR